MSCASVDQCTMVDSSSTQPTPMDINAVVSTCACCGGSGHEKSTCQMRIEECGVCGKVGHLMKVCRQREKGDGKGKSQKGNGKGKNQNTDTCYCCGRPGHRKPNCRHRNERTAALVERSVRRVMFADLLVRARTPMLALWRWTPKMRTKIQSRTFMMCGPWQFA